MSTTRTRSMTDKQADQGVVIVRGAADGFAQEVVAGSHHFRTDEPAAVGGPECGLHLTICCWPHSGPALP